MAKSKSKAVVERAYRPTDHESAVIKSVGDKARARPAAPFLKMEFDEATRANTVTFDHEDQPTAQILAMSDMGTGDVRFSLGLVRQIAALGEPGQPVSENASNFALSVIRGVEPTDEVEAMLATQMAAVHMATMTLARRLNHVETIPQQDAAERAVNKLARTFATQVQTLKKYRSKGQQVVRIERVTVNEGGQAIVGAVQTGGGGERMKLDDNPIDPGQRLRDAPRCHAKAKSTGERCNAPAVNGWRVCRVHGAGGGHPAGRAHPSWKHGMRSREWTELRKMLNELVREAREFERLI